MVYAEPQTGAETATARTIDIAYGMLYLASDESAYITGAELVIDGGATAQCGSLPTLAVREVHLQSADNGLSELWSVNHAIADAQTRLCYSANLMD